MKLLPLTPIRFHIMLALAREPAHATLIATRVAYDTFGEIDLKPATLHDNLAWLSKRGWIETTAVKCFSLSENGRSTLEDDLYRWRIVTSRATDTLRRAV